MFTDPPLPLFLPSFSLSSSLHNIISDNFDSNNLSSPAVPQNIQSNIQNSTKVQLESWHSTQTLVFFTDTILYIYLFLQHRDQGLITQTEFSKHKLSFCYLVSPKHWQSGWAIAKSWLSNHKVNSRLSLHVNMKGMVLYVSALCTLVRKTEK